MSKSFAAFLDLSRALAAILVLLVHLRDPLFVGWPALRPDERNLFVHGWFFITGMGFEAVVVFFILSGYLVGGLSLGKVQKGSFTLRDYTIDRVSRLFVVLIPALLLTFVLDRLGSNWFGELGYWNGTNPVLQTKFGPFLPNAGLGTLACNLAMLQPFYCPVFGSNIPLWTLSYEFWFYSVFALSIMLVRNRNALRWIGALLIAGIFLVLGVKFLWLIIAWGLGIAACLYQGQALRRPWWSWIAFAAATCLSRLMQGPELGTTLPQSLITLAQAASFAWVVISMRSVESRFLVAISTASKHLASFSYTLYLTHFPTMLFVLGVMYKLFGPDPFVHGASPATFTGMALYTATFIVVMLIAWLFSRLTEANTHHLRRWLRTRLGQVAIAA